jgi:hypothetical protein
MAFCHNIPDPTITFVIICPCFLLIYYNMVIQLNSFFGLRASACLTENEVAKVTMATGW